MTWLLFGLLLFAFALALGCSGAFLWSTLFALDLFAFDQLAFDLFDFLFDDFFLDELNRNDRLVLFRRFPFLQ